MDIINVYCLPFAGGNRYSYQGYVKVAPPFLNIIPIELPGRGSRIKENLVPDLDLMVDDVYAQIKGDLDQPYAIYGHSMGGLLTYLLTKKIRENGHPAPLHLFLTGC